MDELQRLSEEGQRQQDNLQTEAAVRCLISRKSTCSFQELNGEDKSSERGLDLDRISTWANILLTEVWSRQTKTTHFTTEFSLCVYIESKATAKK